ncbi:hypothetical protein [uncultured Aquabacterium sp.]|uniref:hypothetical protein n=1 Tax=Aquabacterium sp. TaxID=1872578 RepID=UPI0025FE39D3|nr:hypothetical protein [uncultured Aquabacterium sp.]
MTLSRLLPALLPLVLVSALSSSLAAPADPRVTGHTIVYRCHQAGAVLFSQTPCEGGEARSVSRDTRSEAQVHEALVRHAEQRKLMQQANARRPGAEPAQAVQPASLSGSHVATGMRVERNDGAHTSKKERRHRPDRSRLFTARAPRQAAAGQP